MALAWHATSRHACSRSPPPRCAPPPAQGDGTDAIFSGDPSVFTLSLHCAAQPFPHHPVAGDWDVALPAGTTDEQYMQVGGWREEGGCYTRVQSAGAGGCRCSRG